MSLTRLFSLAATLCLATTLTHAAGFSLVEVPAGNDGPALRGAVWTPCKAPVGRIELDPLVIDGVKNCPIEGTRLPLIIVSHGQGGSLLGHHDTASALADAGFVVASINHPGDNFQDRSRRGDLSIFTSRPADMKRLADYMLGGWAGRSTLNPDRVGIFGFSRGGYTGLVAAGAVPNFKLRRDLCPPLSFDSLCRKIRGDEQPTPPVPDPRIKAAVIVDPLSFFNAEGLRGVAVPIQLWASQHGGDGVTPASVEAVRRDLPKRPEWRLAANAAHFAFLAPCTPALTRAAPEICTDNKGFDRVAFHSAFNREVVGFLRRALQ
ncbi:alpha/beta hydrolase family protein [Variovorax sp. MHTC-1]|uniref:alpha/beta hydrolase family protein n=1 Tax=Variovorax sp. MHTC-1 TaxID=2495593 RepID=UPI000F89340A|nr:dienelactone hydrolase [Variovorax sp. MHTC-1]RST47565.1 dienelactone hydrolase [Variovorax sp. MHTC-1]